MDATPNINLPYIAAAQAQKHVTHNEAIRELDALVHLAVRDRDATSPPATLTNGDRYLVPSGATGAFAGQATKIAAFQDGAWQFYAPRAGWRCWVEDEQVLLAFDGTLWRLAVTNVAITQLPLLGLNATASTTDRLAVASASSLFTHAGTDHRLKVNKNAAADTASVLFQTNFSGRAEIGLTGDDALRAKVSADGTTWRDALIIDAATGAVATPSTPVQRNGSLLVNGDFAINQRSFAGGALAAGSYGHDRWKAATAGTSYTVAASGVVTLASGTLTQIIEPTVFGFGSLASATLCVSVETPSHDLAITLAGVSATITAGSGRRSVVLSMPPGATGTLALTIARTTAGSCTFSRVQVEPGKFAAAWSPRRPDEELSLCRRYYQRSYPLGTANGANSTDGVVQVFSVSSVYTEGLRFPVRMRVTPAVTLYSRVGNVGSMTSFVGGVDVPLTLAVLSPSGAWFGQGSGLALATLYEFHFAADAEL